MTDRIEPVLSAEEWAAPHLVFDMEGADAIQEAPAKALAYANSLLPDSDDRKITHAKLQLLDDLLSDAAARDPDRVAVADAFIDALESYLPPE